MTNDPQTPFNELRHKLRTHSLPLRIAVARVFLSEITNVYADADRKRFTSMLTQVLQDIAEDHT